MTEPEIRFWHAVRAHRFHGLGFRRQVPLAGYVVDFVCHDYKLVVEIDGGSHTVSTVADATRTARLVREGYRVERFWNHDVMGYLDGVLDRLAAVLGLGVPPSLPSPTRGEGKNAPSSRPSPATRPFRSSRTGGEGKKASST
jgi:very-short-patch-repair endonuclease